MKTATARNRATTTNPPRTTPVPLVESETVVVPWLIDQVDEYTLTLLVTGPDTMGMMLYVAKRIDKYAVNIESASCVRLVDRPALSLRLHSENAAGVAALAANLQADGATQVPGKRILPVKSCWLRVLAPDTHGLAVLVAQVLYDHDINMMALAGTTHPRASAPALGYPYADRVNKIASLKIRVEVPLHQIDHMEAIRAQVEQVGKYCVVTLTDTPERDLAPGWPAEGGRTCKTEGPLKYASPGVGRGPG